MLRPTHGLPARQFMLFAGIGGFSTVCHFATLFVLHETVKTGVVAATTWGALAGALVNYALNRHITFALARPANFALSRFAVVALVGLGLNSAGMALLEQLAPGVNYLLRQCVVSSLVLAYSFTLSKYWTFRDSTTRDVT